MTLTHNQTTEWADSATDEPKYDGLSPFGARGRQGDEPARDAGRPEPRLAGDDEGRDRRQPRAGHLLAQLRRRRSTPHPRNVPDDVLRLLPANGGVVMVNFVPGFLSQAVWDWAARPARPRKRG